MHTPGTKPVSIDEYLSEFPPAQREVMENARRCIHAAVPGLTEAIRWSMPAFLNDKKKIVLNIAGATKHFSLFPGVETVEHFSHRLTSENYSFAKGTIRFPYDKPVDYTFIAEIAKYRSTLPTHFNV